jgi:hypothetical protein
MDAIAIHGTQVEAAAALGLPLSTFNNKRRRAEAQGIKAAVIPSIASGHVVENVDEAIRQKLLKGAFTIDELKRSTGGSDAAVFDALDHLKAEGANLLREGDRWRINKTTQAAWESGSAIEIMSRPDNTFLFGACGDQHVASKYHREDVSKALYDRYAQHKVQAVMNTGNWIDGEASFNRYDLDAHGLDGQCQLMAEIYPKHEFPTYAVWGDDHEGWYAQREGINVGHYAEGIMRSAGHNWHDVGFMEAHIRLVNANTGAAATLAVVHPGGGSSYAISYRPQKIVESLEGGEKPDVLLLGHYHKMDAGIARNVWYAQTGTCQDQTPFMRKKSLEAHVGGLMIHLEQDPETGAIIGFTPSLWRFFNRGYYAKAGAANGRWSKHTSVRAIPRGIQL